MVVHIDLRYEQNLSSFELSCKRYSSDDMLLLLDWDDTLFPTSYLSARGIRSPAEASKRLRGVMATVERRAVRLVRCGMVDRVGIVTTASEAWVRDCLRRWMPRLRAALKGLGVRVTSADEQYCEGDGYDRKYRAFRDLHRDEDAVVIVGDGPYEKWAAKALRCVAENVSFVGFVSEPTPEQIAEQIEFAHRCLRPLKLRYKPYDFQCSFGEVSDGEK